MEGSDFQKAQVAEAVESSNGFLRSLIMLISNGKFYLGICTLVAGIQLNFWSQSYLHESVQNGKELPVLSDLILENIPYWDIDYMYDILSLLAIFITIVYIVQKHQYGRLPYLLVLCGTFHLLRGVFIVLTPFGNPELFDGTQGLFNGFSEYELGVYPSGHVGISFMYFLFIKENLYRMLLLLLVVFTTLALFLSRGHYSIDILSGILFAYAIKSFFDQYLQKYFLIANPQET